ncbi:K02A2.6-like [Cordylochernes scorpioides]|uniref:RNA-directed DNA polymerase n=1 Tax=Cordylochernes scorpioides TaxID=51811 RepID=A0ABY6LDX4_9ARAC|nr:K02A2.6-like [Cordylochernes scorpioides]
MELPKRNRDYRDLKLQLTSAPCLRHFDPKLDIEFQQMRVQTANTLSRDYIANDLFTTPEIEISQNNQVLMVTYSNNRHQDLFEATNNDPVLQEVKYFIENGWPIHKKTMNPLVKPFWDIKEELFEWEGLLCRGVKLVIPKKRRNHILSLLHKAHRGINSTLSLARSTFYWPGMCQEVEEFSLISTKAEMVIEKLKEVFARCGVTEIMMTDNGPPFQSTEMMEFAKEWNVTHTTSSPRFPKSNGMI